MKNIQIVISSEHTGNEIPIDFKKAFANAKEKLETHWGYDIGASFLALEISKILKSVIYETKVSRLLVDCNRSLYRDDLFSEFSRDFNNEIKQEILANYYYPHRNRVEEYVSQHQKQSTVIHLSIHTFTPNWKGKERQVDIGLLFDEDRKNESALCNLWKEELQKLLPAKKVKHNSPYQGAPDGLTAHLRKIFTDDSYMGIEIEVNQKYVGSSVINGIAKALIETLKTSLLKLDYRIPNFL